MVNPFISKIWRADIIDLCILQATFSVAPGSHLYSGSQVQATIVDGRKAITCVFAESSVPRVTVRQ